MAEGLAWLHGIFGIPVPSGADGLVVSESRSAYRGLLAELPGEIVGLIEETVKEVDGLGYFFGYLQSHSLRTLTHPTFRTIVEQDSIEGQRASRAALLLMKQLEKDSELVDYLANFHLVFAMFSHLVRYEEMPANEVLRVWFSSYGTKIPMAVFPSSRMGSMIPISAFVRYYFEHGVPVELADFVQAHFRSLLDDDEFVRVTQHLALLPRDKWGAEGYPMAMFLAFGSVDAKSSFGRVFVVERGSISTLSRRDEIVRLLRGVIDTKMVQLGDIQPEFVPVAQIVDWEEFYRMDDVRRLIPQVDPYVAPSPDNLRLAKSLYRAIQKAGGELKVPLDLGSRGVDKLWKILCLVQSASKDAAWSRKFSLGVSRVRLGLGMSLDGPDVPSQSSVIDDRWLSLAVLAYLLAKDAAPSLAVGCMFFRTFLQEVLEDEPLDLRLIFSRLFARGDPRVTWELEEGLEAPGIENSLQEFERLADVKGLKAGAQSVKSTSLGFVRVCSEPPAVHLRLAISEFAKGGARLQARTWTLSLASPRNVGILCVSADTERVLAKVDTLRNSGQVKLTWHVLGICIVTAWYNMSVRIVEGDDFGRAFDRFRKLCQARPTVDGLDLEKMQSAIQDFCRAIQRSSASFDGRLIPDWSLLLKGNPPSPPPPPIPSGPIVRKMSIDPLDQLTQSLGALEPNLCAVGNVSVSALVWSQAVHGFPLELAAFRDLRLPLTKEKGLAVTPADVVSLVLAARSSGILGSKELAAALAAGCTSVGLNLFNWRSDATYQFLKRNPGVFGVELDVEADWSARDFAPSDLLLQVVYSLPANGVGASQRVEPFFLSPSFVPSMQFLETYYLNEIEWEPMALAEYLRWVELLVVAPDAPDRKIELPYFLGDTVWVEESSACELELVLQHSHRNRVAFPILDGVDLEPVESPSVELPPLELKPFSADLEYWLAFPQLSDFWFPVFPLRAFPGGKTPLQFMLVTHQFTALSLLFQNVRLCNDRLKRRLCLASLLTRDDHGRNFADLLELIFLNGSVDKLREMAREWARLIVHYELEVGFVVLSPLPNIVYKDPLEAGYIDGLSPFDELFDGQRSFSNWELLFERPKQLLDILGADEVGSLRQLARGESPTSVEALDRLFHRMVAVGGRTTYNQLLWTASRTSQDAWKILLRRGGWSASTPEQLEMSFSGPPAPEEGVQRYVSVVDGRAVLRFGGSPGQAVLFGGQSFKAFFEEEAKIDPFQSRFCLNLSSFAGALEDREPSVDDLNVYVFMEIMSRLAAEGHEEARRLREKSLAFFLLELFGRMEPHNYLVMVPVGEPERWLDLVDSASSDLVSTAIFCVQRKQQN